VALLERLMQGVSSMTLYLFYALTLTPTESSVTLRRSSYVDSFWDSFGGGVRNTRLAC